MNTIKCGIKLNEHHTGVGVGVTPSEVLVLTEIHYPGVNEGKAIGDPQNPVTYPIIVSPVADGVALTEVSPSVPAEEQKLHPLTGKVIPAVPAIPAKTHKRTDAEELARLKRKYTQTLDGDPKKHIVTQLFPGIAPKLPATFEEIGLKVAAPTPGSERVEQRGQPTLGHGRLPEDHNLIGWQKAKEAAEKARAAKVEAERLQAEATSKKLRDEAAAAKAEADRLAAAAFEAAESARLDAEKSEADRIAQEAAGSPQ